MKKFSFAILTLVVGFSFMGCVTVQPATPEQLTRVTIVELPGMKKDVIFNKSLEWVATTFGSGKSVLEYSDKADGKIIGNIVLRTTHFGDWKIKGTIQIDIKDNKVKFQTTGHHLVNLQGGEWPIDQVYYLPDLISGHEESIQSYKSYMSQKTNSNW